jgi:hypothetical protein
MKAVAEIAGVGFLCEAKTHYCFVFALVDVEYLRESRDDHDLFDFLSQA